MGTNRQGKDKEALRLTPPVTTSVRYHFRRGQAMRVAGKSDVKTENLPLDSIHVQRSVDMV